MPRLPATAGTVIACPSEAAVRPDGSHAYAASTLTRRAAAINARHAAGQLPPGAGGQAAGT